MNDIFVSYEVYQVLYAYTLKMNYLIFIHVK